MNRVGALVCVGLAAASFAACNNESKRLARDCRGADLVQTTIDSLGATGHELDEVHLRNRSETTCSLRGYPK